MRLIPASLFLVVFFSSSAGTVRAQQSPSVPSDESRAKEPYVIELLENKIRFERDGKGFRDFAVRIKIKSESAVHDLGNIAYPFASSFESLDIRYVRVRKPDGTVIETPATDIQELDSAVSREAPMYTDQREKHIPVKGLAVGDLLEINARWTIHDPIAPNHFWFDHSFFKEGPCLKEVLEIDVPKNVLTKIRASDRQPSVHEDDSRRIYSFETSNAKRPEESKVAEWQRNYHGLPPPDVQISSFSSWGEVGDWFGSLIQPKIAVTPELRAKTEELTKTKSTEDEKIRALYDFVSFRFRYIGVDLGLSRYTPHAASEVFSNRYGDCKDKHTLLATLLQAAGISSNAVLISSKFKIDPSFPSPSLFDHVITAIPKQQTLVFLDTTPEVAPFGLLLASLRGRQALMISSSSPARLVDTPLDPPFTNREIFRVDSSIDSKGTLDAKMRMEDRGDAEVALRAVYRATPQNRWQELTQGLAARMGFAGTVSDVEVSQPEATAQPFSISFSYHRTEFPDWKTHRILLPSPPFFVSDLSDEEKASKEPLPLGSPQDVTYQSTVKFPPGFSPWLPQNVDQKTKFAEFSAAYSIDKDTLHGTLRFTSSQNEVPGSERSEYGSLAKTIQETQQRYIFVNGNFPDNIAVNSFFANMPTATTIPLLEQALGADPENDGLLLRLSTAYRRAGRSAEAISILQKAIDAHSDVPAHLFLALGLAYVDVSEPEKALAEFKKVVGDDAEPRDLNEIAYALAEANSHLPEALDYSTRAVTAVASQTMDIDPEEAEPTDFALVTQLAADWDTLGWVMFRRGDFSLAEGYLAAAWQVMQDATIGEHLVEVYEKLGKKQKAAAVCNMANAAFLPGSEAPLAKNLSDEMIRLRPFMRKAAVVGGPNYVDGHVALTDIRMFSVPFQGKYPGQAASAQFLISLTNGPKVEQIVFVSGTQELRAANAALSSIKYLQSFPDTTPARIIRKATLNCNVYSKDCTLILMPADEAAVVIPKLPLAMKPPGT